MTDTANPSILHSRQDARQLTRFLQTCHAHSQGVGVYHIGDVWWFLAFSPPERIAIWHDPQGAIEGFVWLEGAGSPLMHIRPDLRGSGRLEQAMMDWTVQTWPDEKIWTRVFGSDVATQNWLLANGFELDPFSMVVHRRDMNEPIAESPVPAGFQLRHVRDDELAERAEAHRDAFNPSRLTLENYLQGRAGLDYDPELDVVAVAPDGTIASYCIAWYDSANQLGYFEPVGTRAAFRGQRLGQAVLNEALRRLKARGARVSNVATNTTSTAARRLYQSVGFVEVDSEQMYVKTLSSQTS